MEGSTFCGIDSEQMIRCFEFAGEVTSQPLAILGPDNASAGHYTSISVNRDSVCALSSQNEIVCWSFARNGNADADGMMRWKPSVDEQLEELSLGADVLCALGTEGGVYCRVFDDDDSIGKELVEELPDLNFDVISVGHKNICGVTGEKKLKCWGPGTALIEEESFHEALRRPMKADDVVAGRHHICVKDTKGGVKCWGPSEGEELFVCGRDLEGEYHCPWGHHVKLPHSGEGEAELWLDNGWILGDQRRDWVKQVSTASFEDMSGSQSTTCGLTDNREKVLCWGWGNLRFDL